MTWSRSLSMHKPRGLFIWFYVICGMIVIQTQLNSVEAECKDKFKTCDKKICHLSFMHKNCKKSCGYCGKNAVKADCKDSKSWCKANDYMCHSSLNMKKWCRKTCGVCGGKKAGHTELEVAPKDTAQGIECKNTKSELYCLDRFGVCMDPNYPNVKKECKKTCALCPGYKNGAYTPMKKSSRVPYKELAASAKEVYLNCNEISAIRYIDFKRLKRVRLLLLSNNKITSIADNSFSSLKHLRTLSISMNKLTRITRRTFAGILRLRDLYLDNNHISSIQSKSFYYIPKLKTISLEANRLKSVSEEMFPKGYNDLEIGLYLNPIKCDNRIKWFVKGVKSKRIRSNKPPCQDMLQ